MATDLRVGDGCRARADATLLQHATSDAIAGGDVPASLATPLTSSVTTLIQRIVCRPQKPTPKRKPKPSGHDHYHHRGHADGNGHGTGGD